MRDYSERLKDPRWQQKRLKIMERDGFKCRLCTDAETTLHVHHLFYEKGAEPWEYPDLSLVTVCDPCHRELHESKFGESLLQALIAGGANLGNLCGILYAVEFRFTEGLPGSGPPLSPKQWDQVIDTLTDALSLNRSPNGKENAIL